MQIVFAWKISPWKISKLKKAKDLKIKLKKPEISKLKKAGIYQNPLVLRCRCQIHSNAIDKEMLLIIVKRDCNTLVVNNNCNKWNCVTFLNISWPGYKNLQHKIRRRINFKWILTTCHVIYIPFSLSYMAKKRRRDWNWILNELFFRFLWFEEGDECRLLNNKNNINTPSNPYARNRDPKSLPQGERSH